MVVSFSRKPTILGNRSKIKSVQILQMQPIFRTTKKNTKKQRESHWYSYVTKKSLIVYIILLISTDSIPEGHKSSASPITNKYHRIWNCIRRLYVDTIGQIEDACNLVCNSLGGCKCANSYMDFRNALLGDQWTNVNKGCASEFQSLRTSAHFSGLRAPRNKIICIL